MKGTKVKITTARNCAEGLFETAVQSINWDAPIHFEFNGWLDKYGDDSVKYEDDLEFTKENVYVATAIEEIAKKIKKDYASGCWEVDDVKYPESLYKIDMTDTYYSILMKAFERQLADLTGVGYQAELNLV